MPVMRKLLYTLLVTIVVSAVIIYMFVDLKNGEFPECNRVWAHAGHYGNHKLNSIEGLNAVFKAGARGTEIDVYYLEEINDFIVQHDPLTTDSDEMLRLETVFKEYGDKFYFWLDFKNLKKIQGASFDLMLLRLKDLVGKGPGMQRVIIESTNPQNLHKIANRGFRTSYWIATSSNHIFSSWQLAKHRYYFMLGGYEMISMNIEEYGSTMKMFFLAIPKLLFTVNDEQSINELLLDNEVKVILSDKPLYKDFENRCLKSRALSDLATILM